MRGAAAWAVVVALAACGNTPGPCLPGDPNCNCTTNASGAVACAAGTCDPALACGDQCCAAGQACDQGACVAAAGVALLGA